MEFILMTQQQLQDNRLRIGRRIVQLREEKDWTQLQLAEAADVQQATLSRIEKGTFSVGIDVLSRVAAALGCEVNLVFN